MNTSTEINDLSKLSTLVGPTEPSLWNITLSQLLKQQTETTPSGQCVVFPEAGYRATYQQLYQSTLAVAKGLVAAGIRRGDNIGIFAGNCPPYVELFFAASHIGAALVVLNCTYNPSELRFALKHSGCRLLFISSRIGRISSQEVLKMLESEDSCASLVELQEVILLQKSSQWAFREYADLVRGGEGISDSQIATRMSTVEPNDMCNLQFTSGTTAAPKAAMLTHNNLVNNGRFIGDRMRLSEEDIICCPPPLFHCFGLVLGLLAALTHGSSIVFPSETFQAQKVLQALSKERCTALHGVPAMFSAELELLQPGADLSRLRTGIAAGAPVPRKMMLDLQKTFNMSEITNTYGMTETSPASFMTFTDDPVEKRLSTVGKLLPHMRAKIIDANGEIVPTGARGELCVAGFALQLGYWRNPQKTAEAMRTDQDGIRWMHTGDEAVFDNEGYCRITGRIKDIIIRGGENILPLEIEERLVQHPSIIQASVIGIADTKYGEAVGAFLQHRTTHEQPSQEELAKFVRETLGWHKAPVHVFWLSVDEDFPKTGSGKIKKHVLKEKGAELIRKDMRSAKL
ncbi:putative acyl-CoA synthetase [Lachnellula hyalina]|uniref:Putative acyl-CoA synthetase n=1 Tax=Lachnellula hyalina TaxID=1316788 RepID=A0A8H8R0Y0_9HELO|nr:putative acyl-CoA synthetase [Lachnellula hyalina]TVY26056.1 putative acyl-CoA synthetase [Lachnellula hyalina]